MTSLAFNPAVIAHAWNAFQGLLPIKIATIQNEAEYDRVVSFMNILLGFVCDDEVHELSDLLDLVGQLVEDHSRS